MTLNLSGRAGVRALSAGLGLTLAATTLAVAAPANAAPVTIQILATNDFHGRLLNNTNNGEAGAAVLSGAVKQLRAANANTVFAAAGDLIGASTFESFIQRDKPTIDALNEAQLEVSAAGNHEFDQGYNDLINRVMQPESAANPEGGANWQYIAANVRKKSDGAYALPAASPQSDGATWYQDFGATRVGFVGAVTEDLPSLVSPSGIADIAVSNIVNEVNAAADRLTTVQGADIVVLLVHEGAATPAISSATDPSTAFGRIVNGVDSDVDAIVSGHTHLAYNHSIGGRPVVSAGQYGTALNQLLFTVDDVTGAIASVQSNILNLKSGQTANYPVDAATKAIVYDAVAQSAVLGARPLGHIAGEFNRAKLANGTTENRGGESTLGNLVAEVQRWATREPESGAAQIAFMNPGGLREDMVGNNAAGYPAVLTFRQAAGVQSFANTLVNMRMTGAQIKTLLEQQWQRDSAGQVPSRPFFRLGTSKGFKFTYDPARAEGSRITGIWLDGKALDPATSYSVTANSFLAGGGDNFRAFNTATQKRDTGKVDLQAMVDYMAEFANQQSDPPLPVDYSQHAIGLTWPAGAPKSYRIGQQVEFKLSSLAMTAPKDKLDAALDLKVGNVPLKDAPVDNTRGTDVFDEYGVSNVSSRLTGKVRVGESVLTVSGPTTGTTLDIPIQIRKAKPSLTATVKPGKVIEDRTKARVKVKVTALGLRSVKGKVKVQAGGRAYKAKLKDGKLKVKLRDFGKAGKKKILVKYLGNARTQAKKQVVSIKVRKG